LNMVRVLTTSELITDIACSSFNNRSCWETIFCSVSHL
jgi:hypothetical protein